MSTLLKYPVHVEVQINDKCLVKQDQIVSMVTERLHSSFPVFQNGTIKFSANDEINQFCDFVKIGDGMQCNVILAVLLLLFDMQYL